MRRHYSKLIISLTLFISPSGSASAFTIINFRIIIIGLCYAITDQAQTQPKGAFYADKRQFSQASAEKITPMLFHSKDIPLSKDQATHSI